MQKKKFNGFDKNGYLPYGIYQMNIDSFKEIFSKNKSKKRKEIMEEYQKHLSEIKNTNYCLGHWIGGSFVTQKENPNDIDTLTEFDVIAIDNNNDKSKIEDLMLNSKTKTRQLCHSFRVYKYPPNDELNYKYYLKSKLRILIELFGHDKKGNPKGIIHLIGD